MNTTTFTITVNITLDEPVKVTLAKVAQARQQTWEPFLHDMIETAICRLTFEQLMGYPLPGPFFVEEKESTS